jgi:hypothetical protein
MKVTHRQIESIGFTGLIEHLYRLYEDTHKPFKPFPNIFLKCRQKNLCHAKGAILHGNLLSNHKHRQQLKSAF